MGRVALHRTQRTRVALLVTLAGSGLVDLEPQVRDHLRVPRVGDVDDPGRTDRLFRSLQNVAPSHLADRQLFDFESLEVAED